MVFTFKYAVILKMENDTLYEMELDTYVKLLQS